jgi:hypothetical protein
MNLATRPHQKSTPYILKVSHFKLDGRHIPKTGMELLGIIGDHSFSGGDAQFRMQYKYGEMKQHDEHPEMNGLLLGIIFATQFLMMDGGIATISHYILRVYLWRCGYAPLNYVRFLDYMAEHILLSKAGGGYIFPHQLLLDYFARADTMDTM